MGSGASTFEVSGDAYDNFMGRYSRQLAKRFAEWADVRAGAVVLDVGCGPGALVGELITRGATVAACDPSMKFVEQCAQRHPLVDVRLGPAEAIPFSDGHFDAAFAQLVLHFVSEPDVAGVELRRVVRSGGRVAASMWDFDDGMQMLRSFWDAALMSDPAAPDEARTMRFGRPGEIAELLAATGLIGIEESTLEVSSTYTDFDELWSGFTAGIGPAGAYCVGLDAVGQARLRAALFERVGSPEGEFSMSAVARCARGQVPTHEQEQS